jgi:predicted Zn-dependent protease
MILHPYDIRNQINIAQLAMTGIKLENKPSYVLEAQSVLEDALKKSPRRQQIQYLLAGVYSQMGQGDQAVRLLEDAWKADKKIEGNWWRLALAYSENGQTNRAKQLFAEFDTTGLKMSPEGQQVRVLIADKK